MEINNIDNILSRFKVFNPKTLFPPTAWEIYYWLHQSRCPICFTKLHLQRDGKIARCKSVKKDKFFIRKEVLDKYI